MTREQAVLIRRAVVNGGEMLDDREVSIAPQVLEPLRESGSLIPAGTRIPWGSGIKRARVDLWDVEENNPDNAPELWSDVLYRDGIRVIPAVITVDAAFSYGEIGWWGDVLMRSILPGERTNVYTPEEYPSAWEDYVAEDTPEEVTEA